MIYSKYLIGLIIGILLVSPAFALVQLSYNSSTNQYIVSDKVGQKTTEIAKLSLIQNTNQCLGSCLATIYINTTNKTALDAYVSQYFSVNSDSIKFKKFNFTYQYPYLYVSGDKKLNVSIISKSGIEEKIKLNNDFDWLIDIGGLKLTNWAWFNTSWNYRVALNRSFAENLTNYQIRIDLNSTNMVGTNFTFYNTSSLRLTDENGTEVPFYIWYNTSSRLELFTQRYNITSGNIYQFYIYYNNPTATPLNTPSVMDFLEPCDGTNGGSLSGINGWSFGTNGMYYNTSMKYQNTSSCVIYGTSNPSILNSGGVLSDMAGYTFEFFRHQNGCSSSGIDIQIWVGTSGKLAYTYTDGACKETLANTPSDVVLGTFSSNAWVKETFKINATPNLEVQWNNVFKGSGILTNSNSMRLRFINAANTYKFVDEIIAHKYSNSEGTYTFSGEELQDKAPVITFVSKSPTYVDLYNIFGQRLNLTYNISDTDSTQVDNATAQLYYKTNDTLRDGTIYINGTLETGFRNVSYDNATGELYQFSLGDSKVYPATYNIEQIYMQQTPKQNATLSSTSQYIFQEIINITNKTTNFIEIYALPPAIGSSLQVWLCNLSQASGITTSPNCNLICTITNTQSYNHTHTAYSKHYVCPFTINESTNLTGTLKVVPTMYIYFRPSNSVNWQIEYISNTSRTNAVMETTNNGGTYSQVLGTIDSHIHQFGSNETLYYYVCSNDSANNSNCSTTQNLSIEFVSLPPTSPFVYSPNNSQPYLRSSNIDIQYTQAFSNDNGSLQYYNISLLYSNLTYISTIAGNNGLNLSYNWNISAIPDGYYVINVSVCTNNGLCSHGLSEEFEIVGSLFNITIFNPQNNSVSQSLLNTFNYTVIGSSLTYNCTSYINGSNVYQNTSVINATNDVFTLPLTDNSSYNFNISCNSQGTSNISQTVYFNVTVPHYFSISLLSPSNGAIVYSSPNLLYRVSGSESVYTCNVSLDSNTTLINDTVLNLTTTIQPTANLTLGIHSWAVSCNSSSVFNSTSSYTFYLNNFIINPNKREIVYAIKEIVTI